MLLNAAVNRSLWSRINRNLSRDHRDRFNVDSSQVLP